MCRQGKYQHFRRLDTCKKELYQHKNIKKKSPLRNRLWHPNIIFLEFVYSRRTNTIVLILRFMLSHANVLDIIVIVSGCFILVNYTEFIHKKKRSCLQRYFKIM